MSEIARADDVAGASAIVAQLPDLDRLNDSPSGFWVEAAGSFVVNNADGYHVCRVSYREGAWWMDFSDYGEETEG